MFDIKLYTGRLFCSLFVRVVRDRDLLKKGRDVEVKYDVLQKRSVQKATSTTSIQLHKLFAFRRRDAGF